MSLYRKYRPQKFNEIINQNHVTQTLLGALESGQIGHAYIFAGPRGTGKTSVARILAKAVNCLNSKGNEPCDQCDVCKQIVVGSFLDLIEIDAASNRGIDEIRDLKEKIRFAPNIGKYKVYIIDEVHMLTREAFNALLKTLEEPPSHAIFVLATTEVHKIPLTILSRCQRFDFRKIDSLAMFEMLKTVAKKEKIKIDEETLKKMVVLSEGSARDALSFLDQINAFSGGGSINAGLLESVLGYSNQDNLINILNLIKKNDLKGVISFTNKLVDEGVDLETFLKSLIRFIRQVLLIKVDRDILSKEFIDEGKVVGVANLFSISELIDLAEVLNEVIRSSKFSFLPQLYFELAIMKLLNKGGDIKKDEAELEGSEGQIKNLKIAGNDEIIIKKIYDHNDIDWEGFLQKIKKENMSIAIALKGADFLLDKGIVIIQVYSQFYFDRLNSPKSQTVLKKIAEQHLGRGVEIKIIKSEKRDTREKDKSAIEEALSVFGGEIID